MKINFIAVSLCIFITVFVLLHTSPCSALITGTVTDTAGSPVSGALVTFTDESNTERSFSDYTDKGGKYELPISPVHVKEETPVNFQLFQNYPNPFNPSTTIPFSLNKAGFVNLSVYNITGQKVRTIIDNYQSAGSYTITWYCLDDNNKSVAAGIYIYQLRFGDAVESQKMLLLDGGSGNSNSGSSYQILAKAVGNAEGKTYRVVITKDGIIPYILNRIEFIEGKI